MAVNLCEFFFILDEKRGLCSMVHAVRSDTYLYTCIIRKYKDIL